MTLPTTLVHEIRSAGEVTNGGGFFGSGTDFSQQDSPEEVYTDLVIDGSDSTKITSVEFPFDSTHEGNVIYIPSGTGFNVDWFHITDVTAGVATLHASAGTLGSTGGAGNLGGAMFWIDAWFEVWGDGNLGWIKQDGTHTITTLMNVANDGTAANPMRLKGYKTTRGDAELTSANRPVISHGTGTFVFDDFWQFANIDMVSNSSSTTLGLGQGCNLIHSKIKNTGSFHACDIERISHIKNSEFQAASSTCLNVTGQGCSAIDVYLHDSTGVGLFISSNAFEFSGCGIIADSCLTGVNLSFSDNAVLKGVSAYNCTTGFIISGVTGLIADSMILDNNTTGMHRNVGVADTNNPDTLSNINFSNNSTDKTNIGTIVNETSLDPQFVDAAGGDFETGSNMEVTYTWPGGLTSTTVKLGAVQNTNGAVGAAGFVGYTG